ncbi:F-box/kelch-repeat protein skip30 [Ranunculus cassubicifolius]
MSVLIEGLPDAVSLRCLARVPLHLHPILQLVCRTWRGAVKTPEFFRARREIGASEDMLCVCAFEPENLWQLYDPRRDLWMTLPILPSEIRHLAHFGVVSMSGKMFVLGGGSDAVDLLTGDHYGIFATNEVWCYDPVFRYWTKKAPMLVPRAMFACCILEGRIIVAGGFTTCRKSISKAEIYDPEKDIWVPINDLPLTHNSACSGVVINGRMHVLHKGISTVQIFENPEHRWVVEDYGWIQGPMAVVRDELYVLSHGFIIKQGNKLKKKKVVASAHDFQSRIGFAMIGLGKSLYVIGGVVTPGRWNLDIKLVSDVDVLTVGCGRSSWKIATPMSECHGTVLGCTVMRI